jgi:hypothetical protein
MSSSGSPSVPLPAGLEPFEGWSSDGSYRSALATAQQQPASAAQPAAASLYELQSPMFGQASSLEAFKGQVVVVVNVASL